MSIPPELWAQLPTALLSSTLTSSDAQAVTHEVHQQVDLYERKSARAEQARRARRAEIRHRVLQAWAGGLIAGIRVAEEDPPTVGPRFRREDRGNDTPADGIRTGAASGTEGEHGYRHCSQRAVLNPGGKSWAGPSSSDPKTVATLCGRLLLHEVTGAKGKDLIPEPRDNVTLARKSLFAMAKLLKEVEEEDAADGRHSPQK